MASRRTMAEGRPSRAKYTPEERRQRQLRHLAFIAERGGMAKLAKYGREHAVEAGRKGAAEARRRREAAKGQG